MTFNPHPTAIEGAMMAYVPASGLTPRAILPYDPTSRVILRPGDLVRVISTWDREHYLPGAVLLAYVLSMATGETTHVAITELRGVLA